MRRKDVKVIFSEFDGYCEALDRNGCISYPVTITWTREGQHYGKLVVVIRGECRAVGDLPPGELQVPFEILDEVRQAGYGARSQRGGNQGLLARGYTTERQKPLAP